MPQKFIHNKLSTAAVCRFRVNLRKLPFSPIRVPQMVIKIIEILMLEFEKDCLWSRDVLMYDRISQGPFFFHQNMSCKKRLTMHFNAFRWKKKWYNSVHLDNFWCIWFHQNTSGKMRLREIYDNAFQHIPMQNGSIKSAL